MKWFSCFLTLNWVQVFVSFLLVIMKLTTGHRTLLWGRIIFHFVLRFKISCLTVRSYLRILLMYLGFMLMDIFFCFVMVKHLFKIKARLGISLVYWFGAKVFIFFLLHLSHHALKKRLVLRELFDEGFDNSLKFRYLFLKMFAVFFWHLWLKFLNFNHIFHGEINVLKVDSSLLRVDFEINKFSLSGFLTVIACPILMEPGVFLSKTRLACDTETIDDKTGCGFVTPLTMMKWYFVGLLHDGRNDEVELRK